MMFLLTRKTGIIANPHIGQLQSVPSKNNQTLWWIRYKAQKSRTTLFLPSRTRSANNKSPGSARPYVEKLPTNWRFSSLSTAATAEAQTDAWPWWHLPYSGKATTAHSSKTLFASRRDATTIITEAFQYRQHRGKRWDIYSNTHKNREKVGGLKNGCFGKTERSLGYLFVACKKRFVNREEARVT